MTKRRPGFSQIERPTGEQWWDIVSRHQSGELSQIAYSEGVLYFRRAAKHVIQPAPELKAEIHAYKTNWVGLYLYVIVMGAIFGMIAWAAQDAFR